MRGWSVTAIVTAGVALSLVGAPISMSDWSEQATFHAERIEESEIRDDVPIVVYESISPPARRAVEQTIDSPDGTHTVYGRESWPDEFVYSDYTAPGRGMYVVAYDEAYYEFSTFAGGGFPFVYWAFELPFVLYGILLGGIGVQTARGRYSVRLAAMATVPGVAAHLLGPRFDFPLVTPRQFVWIGVLAVATLAIGLLWERRRTPTADG